MNEQTNLDRRRIEAFVMGLVETSDLSEARRIANQAFSETNPELKMTMLSTGAALNPLAVPSLPKGADTTRIFTLDAWRKSIAMARIVASNTTTPRVLVAAAPKTGSTFLSSALATTYNLAQVSVTVLSARTHGHSTLGGALRDHDIDELALITNSLIPSGYVSHHHMICTPYLGKQLSLYGVRPVITRRNIFDTLVSLDEFSRKYYVSDTFRSSGLPDTWFGMDFDDRMEMLLDIQLPWFMRYYSTWKLGEQAGDVKPLWITYETDILGDKTKLAERLANGLALPASSIPVLATELANGNTIKQNFNKGVAGRGAAITGQNRRKVEDFFHRFRSVCDFSDILDG